PADAAEGFAERADDDGNSALEAGLLEDPAAVRAERAASMRVVTDEDGVLVLLADLDDLLDWRLVTVERVYALDEHHRVLPLAAAEDAVERAGAVVVEEPHLGLTHRGARGEEGAVEDAGVAQVVEDERRVLVGERHDGADHRLVAGGEQQARLELEVVGEPLLELDVRRGRRLHTRRAEPAGEFVERRVRGLDHLRVRREPK